LDSTDGCVEIGPAPEAPAALVAGVRFIDPPSWVNDRGVVEFVVADADTSDRLLGPVTGRGDPITADGDSWTMLWAQG